MKSTIWILALALITPVVASIAVPPLSYSERDLLRVVMASRLRAQADSNRTLAFVFIFDRDTFWYFIGRASALDAAAEDLEVNRYL